MYRNYCTDLHSITRIFRKRKWGTRCGDFYSDYFILNLSGKSVFFSEICKTFREMETLFVQDVDKVNNCQNYMYKTSHIIIDTDSTVQVMKPCTTD